MNYVLPLMTCDHCEALTKALLPPCVYEEWLAHLWEFSREGLSESLAARRN